MWQAFGQNHHISGVGEEKNINDGDQIKGIVIEGAASFVEEITRESTQALVY